MAPDSFAVQRGNEKLYKILKRQREAFVVKCYSNRKGLKRCGIEYLIHACVQDANKTI
jgi:hypothetical protein